ncbi:MAG: B12-binding domain-containing radical SAM protein [Desulfurellaceae bacterium]|nr:B12-binding domain-containing radical SAM protein [Desulfurellaceae bacterium]
MPHPYRRILLVYPEFPLTYWGMQYVLPIFNKKALMPPLGLITIAALTPAEYEFRLVDLNCRALTDDDLEWADMVCLSAMISQKTSLFAVAERCQAAGKLVVLGGPFPTACPEECQPYADVLVLNEGELTWPAFLADLEAGDYQQVYTTADKPDVTQSPTPRFDLLDIDQYSSLPIQFSRGCPFQCEFCDIIVMFGRRPRTKTPPQILAELDALYQTGYRGSVFMVDDNFIGNKHEVKKLLPELTAWNEAHAHPFAYITEATVDLANDEELVAQMVTAGFKTVFLGLETPSIDSLKETKKYQNIKRPLVDSVKAIQRAGLMVTGGFILGFDSDGEDIFDRQIDFIRQIAVPNAMVGLLVALPSTPLYTRLEQAGRLLDADSDRFTTHGGFTNIVPVLPRKALLEGYRKILHTIYTPHEFFDRLLDAQCRQPGPPSSLGRVRKGLGYMWHILGSTVVRSAAGASYQSAGLLARLSVIRNAFQQLPEEYKRESLRFIWTLLKKRPDQLPNSLYTLFMGVHLYRFTFEHVLPELDARLAQLSGTDETEAWHAGGAAS